MANETMQDRLAVTAPEAAAMLGISVRHFWSMHATGRIPRPVRLGRSVRWRRDDIEAWLEAGCPAREAWKTHDGS